ncbi:MAG: phosphate signaling complex protein PhoU [Polyangiaceae bacterium]
MPSQHTSKVYEQELRTLRERVLLMGSLAEEMIQKGVLALRTRDTQLAHDTRRVDRNINRLECEVDEMCLRILAMRQPVASDLRFITTALKIVTDLERIGDIGVNICERVAELNEEPPLPEVVDVTTLADQSLVVLHEALDSLVSRDVDRATALLGRDDQIDEHYSRIFQQVLAMMSRDPSTIYRATRIQSIAKYLERIGDHAMNIAETVVFLVKGTDIRHDRRGADSDPPPAVPPRR